MASSDLTAQRLRQLVHYDPDTGVFSRRRCDGTLKPKPYGCIEKGKGYIVIGLTGYGTFRAHRLAWLYVYGAWPRHEIDHINGVRADNRISNLRDATRAVNMQNLASVSGRGAYKWRNKWRCVFNGQHVGMFSTKEDASRAYLEAKLRLHEGYVHKQ